MATCEYEVEVQEQPGGPDARLRERFRRCAERRLAKLEALKGHYPQPGGRFDILDAFEGKFVWEMTPEELGATPPTAVYLEVVSVEPVQRPASGRVRVVVRVEA
jgi:hypothetical protein